MTDDQQRARELRKQAAKILGDAYNAAHFFGAADDALSDTPSPHCQVTITAITAALRAAPEARPLDDWHEDHGPVVWWAWDSEGCAWMGEPAWIGAPGDSDWPGYHTHWTPHPAFPAARPQGVK